MTSALALALVGSLQTAYTASFADAWDRWKRVDAAWSIGANKAQQAQAIPHLRAATGQLYVSRWSDACSALDEALAHLEGRPVTPEMSVNLRFRPPVAEPGKPAKLIVSWAYRPINPKPVNLQIGNRRLVLQPGRNLTLDVLPGQLEPELSRNPELGVPLVATVGGSARTIVLSILKSPRSRIDKLIRDEKAIVRDLGQKALAMMEAPIPAEPATSLLTTISVGEGLSKGTMRLAAMRTIPYAQQGSTGMQISTPMEPAKDSAGRVTLVVGTSGFGGEAGFFESLGQGSAPVEANRRGWLFVGATPSAGAVRNVVDWVQGSLGVRVGRVLTLGFGTGAEAAIGALAQRPLTAAIALISPANAELPRSWSDAQLYVAAGAADANRFLTPLHAMAREMGGKPGFKYEEFEDCEHLTVAAQGVAGAFAFFDSLKP